jgi:hypothetical protein
MKRGVLYIVWGDRVETALQRSMASLKAVHPELPVHVERLASGSLREKTRMGALTPFESTLYLDADTVVLGNLNHAFDKAEQFGLACSICEAPWLRRYGAGEGDGVEYNTGVLFFTNKARAVFESWRALADTPSQSRWTTCDNMPRGLAYDDQASFGRAAQVTRFNPFVLPINYNLRPQFHRSFFLPIKLWHSYSEVPLDLVRLNIDCERNARPTTYYIL